jgi:hypothetical protein
MFPFNVSKMLNKSKSSVILFETDGSANQTPSAPRPWSITTRTARACSGAGPAPTAARTAWCPLY